MQPRSQNRSKIKSRRRHTIPRPATTSPGIGPAATFLTLPAFDKAIPAKVTVNLETQQMKEFADRLVCAGVLKSKHWKGDLDKAMALAMDDYTTQAIPHPIQKYHLTFTDRYDDQLGDHSFPDRKASVGMFILHMSDVMDNGPAQFYLEPPIRLLEKFRPQLGQTVLAALGMGLMRTCRGLTPMNGLQWVDNLYWMGEGGEIGRVTEELTYLQSEYNKLSAAEKTKKKPPTAADVDCFKLADYTKAFPEWVLKLNPVSNSALRELATRRCGRYTKVVRAAARIAEWFLHPKETLNDCGHFDYTSYDLCPWLLQWNDEDPLCRIWDDMMQNFSQSGEYDMSINAIFAFHDNPTFARALRCLRNYCGLLQLTEDLLRELKKLKCPVRNPPESVRQQIRIKV